MSDTPRTDAVTARSLDQDDGKYMAEDLLFHARQLERELAEAKAWIACVVPKYEALVLPHLKKPVEQWPDAVVGCRAILEGCPLDQWDRDNVDDEINREEKQND